MGLIVRLSWRNLFRQKRRNFLLGSGIAFGVIILAITTAFSNGLVDVLLNDFVADVFGHLVVTGIQGNRRMISDRTYIEQLIRETIPAKDLVAIVENPVLTGRGIGNGEVDDVIVQGEMLRSQQEKLAFFHNSFTLVAGDFGRYFSKEFEYPVVISAEKAQSLKVKVNDQIRLRVPMVTGQLQAARLTVVAIVKANNAFKSMSLLMDGRRLKRLLGYQSWESPGLKVMLKNPQATATYYEDRLRQRLQAEKLAFFGNVNQVKCQVVGLKPSNRVNRSIFNRYIHILAGDPDKVFAKEGVLISKKLAQKLNLKLNEEFVFEYLTKYRGLYQQKLRINAIYEANQSLDERVILSNDSQIYPMYNKYQPQSLTPIPVHNPLYPAVAEQWKLYEHSKDSQALQKKYMMDRKNKTRQAKLDVITMYQGASQVLKMEQTLNLVTGIAFLLIFFIIQIGVINTTQITVKERTREIGTARAIGMQKNNVLTMFMMETLMLTAISCVVGMGLGLVAMWLLSLISWNANTVISMILKNRHLFFKVNMWEELTHFGLIMAISGVTAYFPARSAAKLPAIKALQHYE